MMMTELMLERMAADASVVVAARGRSVATKNDGATSEERLETFLDCERLAAMPLPELLYYALVREEIADELA